jgi:apolipoprotein N-acyltransferase
MDTNEHELSPLSWLKAVLLVLGAAACFHTAYTPANSGPLALLIVGYVVCLVQLARLRTTRRSFYIGFLTGLICFGPQLGFFWRIFGPAAIALWAVLALWIALFVALTHAALVRLGAKRAVWLIPFLWTGLEYFRSELYYLKFSWLNAGYAFAGIRIFPFSLLGVYGVGFYVAVIASLFLVSLEIHFRRKVIIITFLPLLIVALFGRGLAIEKRYGLQLAGIQMEFPTDDQILRALDNAASTFSNLDLIVLSEYTLDGPPSQELKDWCRTNGKFLIVGGKDPAPGNNFYNTAFVIGTNGEVVFKQAKSVPIQFFKDGLPAPEQKLWDSPWGKIGICICYDLSYTRVTDELVRQGAQMLIVPTMDVVEWGRHQHELHARIAPVRAAEYGIPIFRLASSGISQGVDRSGNVRTSAPFPGEGEMIFFSANLNRQGLLPLDRYLAPFAVIVTGAFIVWLLVTSRKPRIKGQQIPA